MITNLTAFTFYDLTIAGYTRKGLGAKHPVVTVRTHEEGNINTSSTLAHLSILCINHKAYWI